MTVMPPLMSSSSHMKIAVTEESAGFVGITGKRISMSRGTICPIPCPATSSSGFHPPVIPPSKPAESCSSMPPPSTNFIYQSTAYSTASSSHTSGGSCQGSDDEHHHYHHQHQRQHQVQGTVDEKRQKRMLSNRESARRSRMRKQQHLDDLRAHIVQLGAENNHILNKLNFTSQQYMKMEDENRALRSHAMDLCQKLQDLVIALQQSGGGLQSMGFDSEFMDSIPMPQMDVNPFN